MQWDWQAVTWGAVALLLSAVGLAGFGLAVLMALLGESLAPSLGAYASEMRTRALNEDVALADGQCACRGGTGRCAA